MATSWTLPVIVLLPLLSAAVLAYRRNAWPKPVIAWVACSSVFITFAASLAATAGYLASGDPILAPLSDWGPLGTVGLMGDSLSLWWMLIVTGVGFLIHLYSVGYMQEDASFGRFMAQLNYFIFAMSLLVLADNYALLLMGWANVGLASYMLIGFHFTKPEATAAGMKAFTMNMIGEAAMFAGVAILFFHFGTLRFEAVFDLAAVAPPGYLTAAGLLLLLGACAKSAQLPLHTWLPNAMEGPTPVSALIHAATMVTAGVYVVARSYPLFQASYTASMAVAWVGALGAVIGALIAAGQYDIKRVLAFSTLSQIGYMFLGNGIGAYVPATFHFFTHAFFKAALFLCAGIIIHDLHGEQDIRKMGGMRQKNPFAFWTFAAGTLALIGFPFITAGFFSKDEILAAALGRGHYTLFALGFVAAGLTAFYNARLFSLVFFGQPYTPPAALGKKKRQHVEIAHGDHEHHQTPRTMTVPVGILAALGMVAGWIAIPGLVHLNYDLLGPYFDRWGAPQVPHDHFAWGLIGAVTLVMALGLLAGWRLYGPNGALREREQDLMRRPGALARMLYFDDLYDFLFVQPALAASRWVAAVGETRIIDGAVNGVAGLTDRFSAALRSIHTGYVRRSALTLFAGLICIVAYYMFYA
jgi:NADH-quinone oxidoreductase subunit L